MNLRRADSPRCERELDARRDTAEPGRGGYRLERRQIIRRSREDVFAFFSRAENLDEITPDFLRFRIVTPLPIALERGARIEYELRLFGVAIAWRTFIEAFESPALFVDVQERGPYARWVHRHEFHVLEERESTGGGARRECTEMIDRVDYALPLGRLAAPVHALVVRRMLARIFDHRRDRVRELLEESPIRA
jgi:ligand-binding SRPBCC domain-containing protein